MGCSPSSSGPYNGKAFLWVSLRHNPKRLLLFFCSGLRLRENYERKRFSASPLALAAGWPRQRSPLLPAGGRPRASPCAAMRGPAPGRWGGGEGEGGGGAGMLVQPARFTLKHSWKKMFGEERGPFPSKHVAVCLSELGNDYTGTKNPPIVGCKNY